jgi:fluoroacetyl-CoA thioesterase
MVRMIEGTCYACVQPHLDETESTVGTHICVSHEGPASSGETVTIKATLREIKKRRLTFDVEVATSTGVISRGTHERAVIDLERMRAKAAG